MIGTFVVFRGIHVVELKDISTCWTLTRGCMWTKPMLTAGSEMFTVPDEVSHRLSHEFVTFKVTQLQTITKVAP